MKGIIFDLLQQVMSERYGDDAWDEVLEASGVEGSYTAVGSYPDEDLLTLVGTGSRSLGVPVDELVRWFGRECIPLLKHRFPVFFERHDDTRSFLLTLNEVIHPEVRKLFPGAYAPSFDFSIPAENAIALGYYSHRNLCVFAEGLIEGSAKLYGERVTVEQSSCTKRGDERCVLVATFVTANARTP